MVDEKADDIGREPQAMMKAHAALKELSVEEQLRVLEWLAKKLNLSPMNVSAGQGVVGPQQHAVVPPGPGGPAGTPPTPKAFLTQKKPRDNVERIACLGYYLARYRSVPQFKTSDLTKLNSEASQPKIPNPSQTVANATRAQYLTQAGGGKKQVTTRGEALVDALPDPAKAKQALDDNPLTTRRIRKKGKKAT